MAREFVYLGKCLQDGRVGDRFALEAVHGHRVLLTEGT